MSVLAHIVYIEISLQIPHAQSLKEKRRHVKSMRDRLRAGFNISVAEIGSQDEWQHSVIGAVMISHDKHYLQLQVSRLENFLLEFRDVVLAGIDVQWL
ncbi:MAG: uncharacterized protein QG652_1433 [Pseudomonadota bacterium]|nr:uncharacterized protein [Pseudomonadota bacterium]